MADDNKVTDLLLRLASNHLHLSQFESLRAILLTLRSTRPDLAHSFILTVIADSPRLDRVLWSPSCPNPSLLSYLSALELLLNHDAASSSSLSASAGAATWGFDKESLKLRVEFGLYVQRLIDGVSEEVRKVGGSEEGFELGNRVRGLRDCVRVLGLISELGWRRVRRCVVGNEGRDGTRSVEAIGEADLICLRGVVWEHADVFNVLCENVRWQVKGGEGEGDSLALTVHRGKDALEEEEEEEEELRVMSLIQRSVQMAHLDAMKECLTAGDEDGAIDRVRFLHLGYGVEEAEYR